MVYNASYHYSRKLSLESLWNMNKLSLRFMKDKNCHEHNCYDRFGPNIIFYNNNFWFILSKIWWIWLQNKSKIDCRWHYVITDVSTNFHIEDLIENYPVLRSGPQNGCDSERSRNSNLHADPEMSHFKTSWHSKMGQFGQAW